MTADVDDLARGIFRTLDLPPAGLRTFAAGLELADGRPVGWFAQAIRYRASDVERGEPDP